MKNVKWPAIITNEQLWERTNQPKILAQIKEAKWKWIVEKTSLDWNLLGARKRGRPKKTWKRTVEEELKEVGKNLERSKRAGEQKRQMEVLPFSPMCPAA